MSYTHDSSRLAATFVLPTRRPRSLVDVLFQQDIHGCFQRIAFVRPVQRQYQAGAAAFSQNDVGGGGRCHGGSVVDDQWLRIYLFELPGQGV